MADVFISYAREDQDVAARLRNALSQRSLSVWWDPELRNGQQYPEVIAEELRNAKVVVALWTPTSVKSRWVYGEAKRGDERGVLLHVLARDLTEGQVPLPWNGAQVDDLSGWTGATDNYPQLQHLLRSVEFRVADDTEKAPGPAPTGLPLPPPPPSAPPGSPAPQLKPRRPGGAWLIPALISLVALILFATWMATRDDSVSPPTAPSGTDAESDPAARSATTVPSPSRSTTRPTEAPSATVTDRLVSGARLRAGEAILSDDGRHSLEMSAEGTLVAATDGDVWWRSDSSGPRGSLAVMQDDGNLVIYPSEAQLAADDARWSSGTNGPRGVYYLVVDSVQGRGFIAIYSEDGERRFYESDDRGATPASTGTTSGGTFTVVTVPCVIGETFDEAEEAISDAGLVARLVPVDVALDSPDANRIIDQSPDCNTEVEEGSTVRLDVGDNGGFTPSTTTSTTKPTTTPTTATLAPTTSSRP